MNNRRRFDRLPTLSPCTLLPKIEGSSTIQSFILDLSIKGVFVSMIDSDNIKWSASYTIIIEIENDSIEFAATPVYRETCGAAFDINEITLSNYKKLREYYLGLCKDEDSTGNEFYSIVED